MADGRFDSTVVEFLSTVGSVSAVAGSTDLGSTSIVVLSLLVVGQLVFDSPVLGVVMSLVFSLKNVV